MRTAIDRILELDNDFHQVGILGAPALRQLVALCPEGGVQASAETGTGQSTLLISQLSQHHTVFALDQGLGDGSAAAAKGSALLKADRVEFVFGPSQQTLPGHAFQRPLELVLLDGPHGFPFPMLEYYYFYPKLAEGALLVIDDTHIPSVAMLVDHLQADAMFEHAATVATTAFFRRTAAPQTDPSGDNWWQQGFNRQYYPALRHFAPQRGRQHAKYWLSRLLGKRLSRRLLNVWRLPD